MAEDFDREGLSSKVREQHVEIEELKEELNSREQKVIQGELAINWVNEMRAMGKIEIDENGCPNIIGNEADQEEEVQEPY